MISQATDKEIHLNISKWGLICGLNDGTDPLMKIVITDFLRTFHNERTLDYISQAFKLYAAQKLDFKDPVYNNMNPTFIGKVLVAYAEYNRKENLKQLAEPKEVLQLSEHKESKEVREKKSYEFIKRIYDNEGQFPFIANWVDAYKHLWKTKLISTTQEEFDNEKKEVEAKLKREIGKKRGKGIKECFEEKELGDPASVKKEAAKNIVQKYIRGL